MTPFSTSTPDSSLLPVTPAPNQRGGMGCVVAFCLLFTFIGLGMFYWLFVRPVSRVVAARNWVAVPCQINSSTLTPYSDSDGTSYSADISYSYKVGAQNYTGNRASFGSSKRGSYKSKQSLVARYPAGSSATAYVNPADPNDVVLERGMTGEIWFGLVSLLFTAFGLGVLASVRRPSRSALNPKAQWKPGAGTVAHDGLIVLRANSSPLGRFIGLGLVSVFWNGIVGFMTYQFVFNSGVSFFAWFGALFFLPFIAIGLLVLLAGLQSSLALANTRPVVTLARGALRPGESAELQYELRGGLRLPTDLQITLEGHEEAIFTRGTDTITDRSTFFLSSLVESANPPQRGSCNISIPAGTMHSLDAPHNKIIWSLKLTGTIPRWPDVSEEWKIIVEPSR